MATNLRKKIVPLHGFGKPTNSTNLSEGELAVSIDEGEEKLWTKNKNDEIVEVNLKHYSIMSNDEYESLDTKKDEHLYFIIGEPLFVTITFKDYDDTIISQTEYEFGDTIIIPEPPTREGYIFDGWGEEVVQPATVDKTYVAQYHIIPKFEITMDDEYDDKALIPLTVFKQGIEEPTIWSHNLSSDVAIIDGTTLRFLKHYEGNVKVMATAGEYSDEKIITVSCVQVPDVFTYSVVTQPEVLTVNWDDTTAELSFVGRITASYSDGHKPTETTQSTYNFTAEFPQNPAGPYPIVNTEMVDLGLPSGTMWAKCNLYAQSETDYGYFFQWGDTKGYRCAEIEAFVKRTGTEYIQGTTTILSIPWEVKQSDQYTNTFTTSSYKYYDSDYTKYNETDKKTILDAEDDAATQLMGEGWSMPTNEQINELLDGTTYEIVSNYKNSGVGGVVFTSKMNGNTLFMPYTGNAVGNYSIYRGDRLNSFGSERDYLYWRAKYLGSNTTQQMYREPFLGYANREYGFTVRGVFKVNALKFTSTDNSTLGMNHFGTNQTTTKPLLYKSTNGIDWQEWDYETINLSDGQSVYIKGDNPNGLNGISNYSYFTMSGKLDCDGDIMNLIGDDVTEIPCDYCFQYLFDGCTSLVNAPELPATTLTSACYSRMFGGCTSLVNAPELPATTLANSCYSRMFDGCTSLVNAPELPATTLMVNCYIRMFYGCTSLVNAPELPATTLEKYCYTFMFNGCTSLVNAPKLTATELGDYCYYFMFYGCTSLVNAPELPATTLYRFCYCSMFEGCTSLVTAPELPATTLASSCYSRMFYGCTSLVNAPKLPATTLIGGCYSQMFSDCTKLNYVKAMFIDFPSGGIYNWLYNVSSTGTFVQNSLATWTDRGANAIPEGWTVLKASS